MVMSIEVNPTTFKNEPSSRCSAQVLISKNNLLDLTKSLENGRLCIVEGASAEPGAAAVRREAVLCYSPESLGKTTLRVSKAFREASGLSLSSKWRITVVPKLPSAGDDENGDVRPDSVPTASEVFVERIPAAVNSNASTPEAVPVLQSPSPDPANDTSWVDRIADVLCVTDVVFPGLQMPNIRRRKERRSFRIRSIDGREDNVSRFVDGVTRVYLVGSEATFPLRPNPSSPKKSAAPPRTPIRGLSKAQVQSPQPVTPPPQEEKGTKGGLVELAPIDGLSSTVKALNAFLSGFDASMEGPARPSAYMSIVLQGDRGTGKTMLLEYVASSGWGSVHRVKPYDKLSTIVETFQTAYEQRPSIVLMDDLHELLTAERANLASVVHKLCEILDQYSPGGGGPSGDGVEEDRPGAPQMMVLATCLDYVKDIPDKLRAPCRFGQVISIPFPDTATRQSILRSFRMPLPPDKADTMLVHWSQQTHAFDANDLTRLRNLVLQNHRVRLLGGRQAEEGDGAAAEAFITDDDFLQAREEIGPSRMNGFNIKPPPVYFRQIHGQAALVRALRKAVDMVNRPERYRVITRKSRGYLLYGPPGCSKTMAAQALATEGGLNYFSVKGGELLNQYVGESERGIRELFARAKSAAPAIIFLDEIDALAGRRADFGDKSAAAGRGPQMVPALLSELDGFEALNKVIVVAATNRPEALDPALLRPGRLDTHLYVALPDQDARRAILADWAAQVAPHITNGPELHGHLDRFAELTAGYSGAEVQGICQKVAVAAADAAPDADLKTITLAMVEETVAKTSKMISPAIVQHFSTWKSDY